MAHVRKWVFLSSLSFFLVGSNSGVGRMAGDSIMAIAYGIETTEDDPYVATAEHAMEAVNASLVPGAFLVDLFPICEFRYAWVFLASRSTL